MRSQLRHRGPSPGGRAPQLLSDAAEKRVRVEYFASLDDFLRTHAEPIERYTTAWVAERLDMFDVERMIKFFMEFRDPDIFASRSSTTNGRPGGIRASRRWNQSSPTGTSGSMRMMTRRRYS